MTSSYAQVTRTYVGQLLFQIALGAWVIAVAAVMLSPGHGGLSEAPVGALGGVLAFMGLFVTSQAIDQFGNQSVRLLPGYARPHLAVLGVLIALACGTAALVLAIKGHASPLGAAAFALAAFALPAWMTYINSVWGLVVVLMMGVTLIFDPVQQNLALALSGGRPALAWAILIASMGAIGWIGVQLVGLSEERLEYWRIQGSRFASFWESMPNQTCKVWLKSTPWYVRPFLTWCDRHVDRVLGRHRAGGPVSLSLWRLPMQAFQYAWLHGAILLPLPLLGCLSLRCPRPLIGLITFVLGSMSAAVAPGFVSISRWPMLGYESLRPLGRRSFLCTIALTVLGDAAILVAFTFVMGIAATLLFDPASFSSPRTWALMALGVATPTLSCAWAFWPGLRNDLVVVWFLGFIPACMSGVAALAWVLDGTISPVGGFLWAGITLLLAVFIAWLAYRRWLVSDFD